MFEEISASLAATSIEIGDVRHLAQAAAGNAKFFVARNRPVLEQADLIESRTGLRIVAPAQLLLSIHSEQDERTYRPELLQETSYTITHPTSRWETSALVNFIDQPSGDRAGSIRARLNGQPSMQIEVGGCGQLLPPTHAQWPSLRLHSPGSDSPRLRAPRAGGVGPLTSRGSSCIGCDRRVRRAEHHPSNSNQSNLATSPERWQRKGSGRMSRMTLGGMPPAGRASSISTSSLELHGATHAYGATSAAEVSELERHIGRRST